MVLFLPELPTKLHRTWSDLVVCGLGAVLTIQLAQSTSIQSTPVKINTNDNTWRANTRFDYCILKNFERFDIKFDFLTPSMTFDLGYRHKNKPKTLYTLEKYNNLLCLNLEIKK